MLYHSAVKELIKSRKISLQNVLQLKRLPIDDQYAWLQAAVNYDTNTFKKMIDEVVGVNNNKNILLIVKAKVDHWALVPSSKLKNIDLDALNGNKLSDDNLPDDIYKIIMTLTSRLGIIPDQNIDMDLLEYLHPQSPFTVDDICIISLR